MSTGVNVDADEAGYRGLTRPEMVPFLPTLPEGAKVLEVGCGAGRFSARLRPAHEVWGIEPSVAACDAARSVLDHALCGLFNDVLPQLPRGYFDLVICNDVIEHMVDHDAFLRDVQAVMKQGAYLVASLPNVRYHDNLFRLLIDRDWQYQDSGILDRTHLRFFTQRSLQRSLREASFIIEDMRGINGGVTFYWNIWSIKAYIFAQFLRLVSFGRFEDIKYLQFGLRARRSG